MSSGHKGVDASALRRSVGIVLLAGLAWVGAGLLESTGQLGRWLAVALLIFFWPALRDHLGPPLKQAYRDTQLAPPWPSLALVVLFLGLLFPLWAGEPPVSRDHGIHYFQTLRFAEAWRGGELIDGFARWSDSLNAGYAYGDSYPLLGYALTSALNLLSFGVVPMRISYALGLTLVWALMVWSIRALTLRALREVEGDETERRGPAARNDRYAWAGAAAAAFFLLDPGASREGGWVYCMFHGVWPQLLATACWLAALELSFRAFEVSTLRRMSVAALATGAALCAHPFAWVYVAMSASCLFIAAGLAQARARGSLLVFFGIHLVALGLALGSIVRFGVASGALARGPALWDGLPRLLDSAFSEAGFTAPLAVASAGALVGGLLLGRQALAGSSASTPRCAPILCALAAMILVCGSVESLTVLRLDLLLPGLKNLQFPRFAMALRPLWSVAAGLGVVWTVLRVRAALRERALAARPRSLGRLLASLLLAPIAVASVDAILGGPDAPVGRPQVLWNHQEARLADGLREQLRAEQRRLEGGQRLRVAFLRTGMSARTYPIFVIADLDAALVLDGHIPAVNHRPQLEGRSPESLRRLGVSHVLFDRPLASQGDDAELAGALETIWTQGGWTLARLGGAEPTVAPWSSVEGGRRVEHRFERDAKGWTLVVEDATAPLTLDVAISPYFRWTLRPEAGGERIELRPVELTPELQGLRFSLPGRGRYHLHRHELAIERGARIASWFFLLLCGFASVSPHPIARDPRQPPPGHEARTLSICTALLILFATGVFLRQDAQLQTTWDMAHRKAGLGSPGGVRWSQLAGASQVEVTRPSTPACSSLLARDPKQGCSPAELRDQRSMLYRHPFLYRCESIHVEGGDTRTVTLRPEKPGELLVMLTVESTQAGLVALHGETSLPLKSIDPTPLRLQTNDQAELVLTLQNKGPWGRRICIAAAQQH